jgi:Uncharacterized protein conserved in bacteria (DUF2251)
MNGTREENPELNYEEFVRARKSYWQPGVRTVGNGGTAPISDGTSLLRDGSEFMLYSSGPRGLVAVFEDFGQSGWFYLYDAAQQKILKSAYVYNRANVSAEEDIVDIGWATDDSACGLALWGEFRAFLGIGNDIHIEKPLTNAEETGIPATKWPAGFEPFLEPKSE